MHTLEHPIAHHYERANGGSGDDALLTTRAPPACLAMGGGAACVRAIPRALRLLNKNLAFVTAG